MRVLPGHLVPARIMGLLPWLAALSFAGAYLRTRCTEAALAERLRVGNARISREVETNRALFEYLSSQEIPVPFLGGLDARTGLSIQREEVADGIVFLIDTGCPGCPLNYPFLEELAQGGRDGFSAFEVIGLSVSDSFPALRDHVRKHGLAIPVVASPSGGLMSVLPLDGTPLSLVFDRGCIINVIVGVIPEGERETLRTFAQAVRTGRSRAQDSGTAGPPCRDRRAFRAEWVLPRGG